MNNQYWDALFYIACKNYYIQFLIVILFKSIKTSSISYSDLHCIISSEKIKKIEIASNGNISRLL